MTRTENSLKNIKFSLLCQGVCFLTLFLVRRVFILVLTQEYLGLDSTFSNILTMLSLAELGVGSAITYSLYKPLARTTGSRSAPSWRCTGRSTGSSAWWWPCWGAPWRRSCRS